MSSGSTESNASAYETCSLSTFDTSETNALFFDWLHILAARRALYGMALNTPKTQDATEPFLSDLSASTHNAGSQAVRYPMRERQYDRQKSLRESPRTITKRSR